jgi:glycosyltransferase involved in cell wall biosynthesis
MKIYCIIPAWNEANNIGRVITEVLPLVDKVVVIDDASTDNTAEVAEQAGATVLKHFINRGQGAALRTGTHYALSVGANIIIHFDADGQFRASDLEALTAPLKTNEADIVFGSRFLLASPKSLGEGKKPGNKMPWTKHYLIMPLATLVNRVFFGIKLTDPQSGLRAFSAKASQQLNWREDRMAHCSEILWLAHHHHLRIKEVPITVIYHDFGQPFSGGFKILKDLFLNKLTH